MFRDGGKASGRLIDFLPDDARLKFRSREAAEIVSIAFSSLLADAALAAGRAAAPTGADRRYGGALPAFGAPAVRPGAGEWQNLPRRDGRLACTRCAACSCFRPSRTATRSRAGSSRPMRPRDEHRQAARRDAGRRGSSPRAEVVDAALSKQQAMRSRRFGEYLTEHQIVSPEQLAAALKQQRAQPLQKLGETLVELGLPHRSRARGSARHRGARPRGAARPDPRRHGGGRRRGA